MLRLTVLAFVSHRSNKMSGPLAANSFRKHNGPPLVEPSSLNDDAAPRVENNNKCMIYMVLFLWLDSLSLKISFGTSPDLL